MSATPIAKPARLPRRDLAAMGRDIARVAESATAQQPARAPDTSSNLAARIARAAAVGALSDGLMTEGPPEPASASIDSGTDRETVTVDVNLVDDNPKNARKVYELERIAVLAEELKADGQIVPAIAIHSLETPGRFTLIDGGYRKRGILAAGLPRIRLELRPCPSRIELYRLSAKANKSRNDQTPIDDALAWQQLIDDGDVPDQNGLIAVTNLSKQTISRTLKILELPSDVLETVQTAPSKFSVRFLYALVQITQAGGDDAVREFVSRALDEEVPHKELDHKLVELTNGVRQRKQRETSRQFLMGSDGRFGKSKVWDSGRMLIDIRVERPDVRDRIIAILQEQLADGA